MDLPELAQSVTSLLVPLLPYWLKAGEKAAEEAGKRLGGKAWDKVEALWNKLRPKVEAKPSALEAAQDVAKTPTDADAQAALRMQLRKLLAEDKALAQEIARLMEEARTAGPVRVIVLHGPGGVGKTRLLLDLSDAIPDETFLLW